MNRLHGFARLAADLELERELSIAHRKIEKLQRLLATKDSEIALLTQRRADFDLSADSVPMLLRLQAG